MNERHAGVDFMARARGSILRRLGDGAVAVADLPRSWPLTRTHVRALVAEMATEGRIVVERGPAGGIARLRRSGDMKRAA